MTNTEAPKNITTTVTVGRGAQLTLAMGTVDAELCLRVIAEAGLGVFVATPRAIPQHRNGDCRYCARYGTACGRPHTEATRADWARTENGDFYEQNATPRPTRPTRRARDGVVLRNVSDSF